MNRLRTPLSGIDGADRGAIPVPVIDAHFHVWQLARGDYGWLDASLAPIYRDITAADWREQAQPCGVDAGVLVQAAPTEAETAFLLREAALDARVLGVVGWVDWLAPDAPQRIRALAREPLLKGLRPMLQDIADPDWILQPALQPALETMAECGLVFDALVRSVHLPRLLALARRHPDLRVVIDHAAKPDIAGGEWQVWEQGLEALATHHSFACKLSGLLTECGPRHAVTAARRWARRVIECFGPDRVLWGSDWPVLELAASYRDWWEECQALLESFPSPQRSAILGGNAIRVYRLKVDR
jgi:L-fuconolactonase